jgi:hypothetical protein
MICGRALNGQHPQTQNGRNSRRARRHDRGACKRAERALSCRGFCPTFPRSPDATPRLRC